MDSQNAGPVSRGLRVINPSDLQNDIIAAQPPTNYPEQISTTDTSQSSTDSHKSCSCWSNCGLEDRTFRIGKLLGSYPLLSIIIGISIVGTGSMGFLNFHIESRPEELWLDRDSPAYTARTTARRFPSENRIKLSILVGAPRIFHDDIFDLIRQIDETVKMFSYRGKNWDDLCFKKDSLCQKFSLLNFLGDPRLLVNVTPELALAVVNQPGNRKFTLLPPYFIAPEDVLLPASNFSGDFQTTQLTRVVYFLQRQEPDRITSSKPIAPEEALRKHLFELFGSGFGNVSVSMKITYDDTDDAHSSPLIPFDYFPALLYACIAFLLAIFLAAGKYTAVRNGFWLAVSGIIGVALAVAFGFGIASAVGMSFTPVHFILPMFLLGMTIFGFLVMEQELRIVADARPNFLRSEKMGLTMKRSFATLVMCLLSNFLVFAVGIGSKLPVVRSFCVFGVTSSVGIFISQVLFLFGCLSAWQGTYERTASSWLCCKPKPETTKDESVSLQSLLQPMFGFIGSNLADNIGRTFVLLAVTVLTGVCIFFLFSVQIVFNLDRYEQTAETFSGSTEQFFKFKSQDDSVACVYLGEIPYSQRLTEFRTFHSYLRDHIAIRPRSISSWFDRYQFWLSNGASFSNVSTDVSPSRERLFHQELLKFVFDKNFQEDVMLVRKSNDQVGILASRLCFRFRVGLSAENYSSAVDNIANVAQDLNLGTAVIDSKMLLEVLVQKTIFSELWILFGAYFVVLLIISALMLQNIVSALIVFISYTLITVQSIGMLSSQKVTFDSLVLVSTFCIVAIISQVIFYEATTFARLSNRPKRKGRVKGALISVGAVALASGICSISTFVPFFNSSLEIFRTILKVSYTTMGVGFVHTFLFLPVALGNITPEKMSNVTHRFRRRLGRYSNSPPLHYNGGVSLPPANQMPNDQVHFVARNPLQRSGSTSSLKLHLKSAGLRAVLESLPSPAASVHNEPVVSTNPNGYLDQDSLNDVEINGHHNNSSPEENSTHPPITDHKTTDEH